MTEAIVAEGLVKKYGDVTALDGIDLEVREGSVMALLGPNGAGKTTAVRIFTTLLIPDGGRAKVAGLGRGRGCAGVAIQDRCFGSVRRGRRVPDGL